MSKSNKKRDYDPEDLALAERLIATDTSLVPVYTPDDIVMALKVRANTGKFYDLDITYLAHIVRAYREYEARRDR